MFETMDNIGLKEKNFENDIESYLLSHGYVKGNQDTYECIEDIWPDYPSKDDFFFDEEEY